jgi:predicted dehydrogenase
VTTHLRAVIVGAGSRGNRVFAELMATQNLGFLVSGVVEPDAARRAAFRARYAVAEARCFATLEEFFAAPRFSDVAFVCSPDQTHFAIARDLSEQGHTIVLEKPAATTLAECVALLEIQRRCRNAIFVAHGLRYAPFFRAVKALLDGGSLGEIRHVHLTEHVGHWHFAHSYVRGQWRRADQAAPIVLTKTSHDLDILQWLINEPVRSVTSHGSLSAFRAANAPPGATPRCVDCPLQESCLYSATRFYLDERPEWPYDVILGGGVDSRERRRQAIETGPYGHCVWLNDNDVCDNQVVLLEFESGKLATFSMHAQTADNTRELRVFCDQGEISGNLRRGELVVSRFSGQKDELLPEVVALPETTDSHGGGDLELLRALYEHLTETKHADIMTSLERSLTSHVVAFLAEESRLQDNVKVAVSPWLIPAALRQPAGEALPEPLPVPELEGLD